jgi:hypothetical protein
MRIDSLVALEKLFLDINFVLCPTLALLETIRLRFSLYAGIVNVVVASTIKT